MRSNVRYRKAAMIIIARNLIAVIAGAFLFSGLLQGATDREKALVTRYVTVMVHSVKDLDAERLAKFRQEPMILGGIAYYYYRESDPEFAELLRGFAATLLRQTGTTLEAEFPVFEKNFTAQQNEEDAARILAFWGFDTETARKIVRDARADRLKVFKVWMEAASKEKKPSEQDGGGNALEQPSHPSTAPPKSRATP